MNIFKNKAGISPTICDPTYVIKTGDAEKFLQNKINAVLGNSNNRILLLSFEASKYFCPMILCLPKDVTVKQKETKRNGELSILSNRESSKTPLDQNVWRAIAPYTFNLEDMKAWKSAHWRQEFKISPTRVDYLKSIRMPSRYSTKGGMSVIQILIDPLRLFHDMLSPVNKEDRISFTLNDCKFEKIKDADYEYSVVLSTAQRRQTTANEDDLIKSLIKTTQRR